MPDRETPDECELRHWRGEADEYTDLSLEQERGGWRESAARTLMAPAPLLAVRAHSPQLWPRGLCGQKSKEGKGDPVNET